MLLLLLLLSKQIGTDNNNNNNIYLSTAPQFLRIGIAFTAVRHKITQ